MECIAIDARLVGALDQIFFCRICEIAFRARTKLVGLTSLFGLPGEPLLNVSKAFVSLFRVRYSDGHDPSFVMLVKPTILGNEPADVVEYAATHPLFPRTDLGLVLR